MNIIRILIILVMASCASTGVGNFESIVQKRASFDFNCPEQYVTVIPEGLTTFAAKGCGGQASYTVHCSLGPCIAKIQE